MNKKGMIFVEIIFSISLLIIISFSLISGTIFSYSSFSRFKIKQLSTHIARDKIEYLMGINPSLLSNNYDSVEEIYSKIFDKDIKFIRTTDLTVNADNSVNINVKVNSNLGTLNTPMEVKVETIVSNWH